MKLEGYQGYFKMDGPFTIKMLCNTAVWIDLEGKILGPKLNHAFLEKSNQPGELDLEAKIVLLTTVLLFETDQDVGIWCRISREGFFDQVSM